MNAEGYRAEIQALNNRLYKLVHAVGAESWRGVGVDEWDREFKPLLEEHTRLVSLTTEFRRRLRGAFVEVDRRNDARLLGDYFEAARDGRINRQTFVGGIARILDHR